MNRNVEVLCGEPQAIGRLAGLFRRTEHAGNGVTPFDEGLHGSLAEVLLTHDGNAHYPPPDISYIIVNKRTIFGCRTYFSTPRRSRIPAICEYSDGSGNPHDIGMIDAQSREIDYGRPKF